VDIFVVVERGLEVDRWRENRVMRGRSFVKAASVTIRRETVRMGREVKYGTDIFP
jgi:hypothetical protein